MSKEDVAKLAKRVQRKESCMRAFLSIQILTLLRVGAGGVGTHQKKKNKKNPGGQPEFTYQLQGKVNSHGQCWCQFRLIMLRVLFRLKRNWFSSHGSYRKRLSSLWYKQKTCLQLSHRLLQLSSISPSSEASMLPL